MIGKAVASCGLAVSLLAHGPAEAQPYPARRITLVVPYTPGTGFDIVGRMLADRLGTRWNQTIVVDNKPGASGNIGAEAVANAPPDGFTILVTGAPHTTAPSLTLTQRFDPVASFTPLGMVAASGVALAVNPNVLPAKSFAEFVAYVKARPGVLNYSSPGIGTLQNVGMELLKQQLGLDAVHVPYRGAGPALTDLLSGQVQFAYLPVHTALPHARDQKLNLLAVASEKRSSFAPDVPSLAELGHPTVEFELWYAVFGPAGLPGPIVQSWEKELAGFVERSGVRENFATQGMIPRYLTAAAMLDKVRSEVVRWRDVIEKAGIKPE
jgi:tripartite-type tricarboxylate transporter receptor subunit TctC